MTSIEEVEKLIKQLEVDSARGNAKIDEMDKSTKENSDKLVDEQNKIIKANQPSLLNYATTGAVVGGGVGLITGGLLSAPAAAVGAVIGVATGVLAGTALGILMQEFEELSGLAVKEYQNYCEKKPYQAAAFCFTNALLLNFATLRILGKWTYEHLFMLEEKLAKANLINPKELDESENIKFKSFVGKALDIMNCYPNNFEQLKEFARIAKEQNIHGSCFLEWSMRNYENVKIAEKTIREIIKNAQNNIFNLLRVKERLLNPTSDNNEVPSPNLKML